MAVSSLGASDSWGDPRSVTGFATFAPVPTLTPVGQFQLSAGR